MGGYVSFFFSSCSSSRQEAEVVRHRSKKKGTKDRFSFEPRWMQITQFSMLRSSPAEKKKGEKEEQEKKEGGKKEKERGAQNE